MSIKRLGARSTNQDRLAELRDQGCESDVLLSRLALVEDEGMRKDLAKLKGKSRVYPELLPTQASLRWSTKNPNLPGFKREFWTEHSGIIRPDLGEWWAEWDWSGIEARMFTGYSGDEEDVALFKADKDIHLFTCAKYLFAWAPNLSVDSPLDGYNLPTDWQGKEDERRVRAKNFRYGVLQYGTDERAILGMPGIEKLGLDRDTLLRQAKRFLEARPKAQAWKAQVWAACIARPSVARTFMGHRRLLFGDEDTRKKEGLNHMIQGSVANLMAWNLIKISQAYPESSLILNKHDGATIAFPYAERASERSSVCERTMATIRAWVEQEWEVGQEVRMRFPATWKVTHGHE